jgi:hypothetical protein
MEHGEAWWRIKEACKKSYDMSGKNLSRNEVVERCTLSILRISSFEGVSSDFITFLVPYVWCISL